MFNVIIGNISSIIAILCDSFSGTRKTKKSVLVFQSLGLAFFCLSATILKGYSAAVQNATGIVRNLFAAFDKKNKYLEYAFIIIPVVLGLALNNRGWIGWLPVIANLQYGVIMFYAHDNVKLIKLSFVVFNILFVGFNAYIMNYVAAVGNIVILATTLISVIKTKMNEKRG